MGSGFNGNSSRADRQGLAILLAILLAVVAGHRWLKRQESPATGKPLDAAERRELRDFIAATRPAAAGQGGRATARPFAFDPNTADSLTFVRLGLAPWQARNALAYRRKGGRWRDADHFSRLYGLSREDFERLRPFIRISREETARKWRTAPAEKPAWHTEKFEEGTVIDLNSCDTSQLKMIPGIGSYYAGKICRYRERLGGFLRVEQIKEVEGLPDGVERWFSVERQPGIRKTNLNRATFKELVRHPYVSYEQAKAIRNHIHLYGRIGSWRDLKFLKEFSEEDFRRLEPYFSF